MIRNCIILFLALSMGLSAQQKKTKLVVGIIVDQMRDEYIDRFYNDFGEKGFKRLLKNGYRMKNMHFNYVPTYTGPGHASVYTGTTPAYHGIVGNYWYHKGLGEGVYCVSDDKYTTLGNPEKEDEGAMAPTRLLSTTITDELKLSSNFHSKVIGMSLKDRGAILPAGHLANWAFWMAGNGNFISSSFYGNELPGWVTQFNSQKLYEKYLNQTWNLLKKEEVYNESSPDNSLFEGKLAKILDAEFPYDLARAYQEAGADIIKTTPFGNNILADFAKEAILNEQLGKGTATDFLAISFSSTDYIGHLLGPRSRELQDTYLRLDETIADLLQFLDQQIGKNNYTLFLTADHACAENPNFMKTHKYNVQNLSGKEIKKGLVSFSEEKFGANFVKEYSNQNLYFDTALMKAQKQDIETVESEFQNYLQGLDFVKLALTQEQLLESSDNFIVQMIAKGYDPKQNGEMVVLYQPGYFEYSDFGTSHGSPYNYDTHVPMIWYGSGIPKGISYSKHYITEIAPTLSQLLHITMPNSTEAIVIDEILEKK